MTQKARIRPKAPRYLFDPLVFTVVILIALGFGGFGYWAATAPLAQGITAPGVLALKDQRRTMQHLEGGIISAITIREGQSVSAGQVLITLTDASAQARLTQVGAEMASRAATLDRLEANLANSNTLTFARLDQLAFEGLDQTTIRIAEQQVFTDQQAALAGQRALIRSKLDRIAAERAALVSRADGKSAELTLLQEELDVQSQARQQQVGNISRLNEVRRQVTVAQGDLIALDRENAVLDTAVAETQQELAQVDLAFRADAAERITTIRAEYSTFEAERAALLDRQTRRQLIAPIDGVIIDLAYPSVGGVVPPGEALFDIVPTDEVWRVDVKFDPKDRDDLSSGLGVNLRFGTLDPIQPPEVTGVLDVIAGDATFEVQTQSYFYQAEVSIPTSDLADLSGFTLSPGIPVEVFMDSGVTRTPLSYFLEPIEVMLRLGLRG